MFVIAKGSIARPDALALHLDDEMRVMRKLKAEGLVKSAYGRAAGPGFHFILASAAPPSRLSAMVRCLSPTCCPIPMAHPTRCGTRWASP